MRLTLPEPSKIITRNFRLVRLQAFNALRGGNHQTVDLGEPIWTCEIGTAALDRAQAGAWRWLEGKLRGMANTLMLWDSSHARPLAYAATPDNASARIGVTTRRIGSSTRRSGSSFHAWGTPKIVAVDRANARIELALLKPFAVISEGDYGHWDDGPRRRLHVTGAAIADAQGRAIVSVEPPPPASGENLPTAFEMYRASGEFVVPKLAVQHSALLSADASLTAVQTLRKTHA